MKLVLVPAAHVLLVLLVGTMPIPRFFAQPSPGLSQEPPDEAPAFPSQAPKEASDHGALGTDRDVHISKDESATTPGENQVRLLLPVSPDNFEKEEDLYCFQSLGQYVPSVEQNAALCHYVEQA